MINAPKDFEIDFIKLKKENGFALLNKKKKVIWFSRWKTKQEIIKEIKGWKELNIKNISLMRNQRAYNFILEKK